jgi:hypothetical protein
MFKLFVLTMQQLLSQGSHSQQAYRAGGLASASQAQAWRPYMPFSRHTTLTEFYKASLMFAGAELRP